MSTGSRVEVDIAVPVYNEQAVLAESITRLHGYLSTEFPFSWRVVIVDNASTDDTPEIARRLAERLTGVSVLRLEEKGRGRALRTAWSSADAQVVAYMDVDLSTDLRALAPLVAPVLTGHSEAAIGTRLSRGSRVVRGIKREFISRMYNRLLHVVLHARFSDAQCGFKAFRADVAVDLLSICEDQEWFFDTEMLMLCQRRGLRIHEIPVDWVDDEDSTVKIASTAWKDLRGVFRMLVHQRRPAASPRLERRHSSHAASQL
jgi:glycosyltransferase involved in cell wall biosynthesis